jgi:hypothetical protein
VRLPAQHMHADVQMWSNWHRCDPFCGIMLVITSMRDIIAAGNPGWHMACTHQCYMTTVRAASTQTYTDTCIAIMASSHWPLQQLT